MLAAGCFHWCPHGTGFMGVPLGTGSLNFTSMKAVLVHVALIHSVCRFRAAWLVFSLLSSYLVIPSTSGTVRGCWEVIRWVERLSGYSTRLSIWGSFPFCLLKILLGFFAEAVYAETREAYFSTWSGGEKIRHELMISRCYSWLVKWL